MLLCVRTNSERLCVCSVRVVALRRFSFFVFYTSVFFSSSLFFEREMLLDWFYFLLIVGSYPQFPMSGFFIIVESSSRRVVELDVGCC